MANRSIPIRGQQAYHRPSQGQQDRRVGAQNSLIGTSLDMVWSYSRSTAFIGSQMPSSPSFVARYLPNERQPKGSNATTTDTDSLQRSSSHDEESIAEQDELSTDGESDTYSDDLGGGGGEAWSTSAEVLPPNAVLAHRDKRKRRRSSRRSIPKGSAIPSMSAMSETSALLDNGSYPSYGSSPPEDIPFARRNDALKAHIKQSLSSIRGESALEVDEEDEEHQGDGSGLSTFAQSLFNSCNVLVGVAILAEPLAFAHAGWVLGILITLFCCLVTNYTAKILAQIIHSHAGLSSYTDIGALAFGDKARMWISLLFALELSSLSVALVVLFGDSMSYLIPRFTSNEFKLIGFFVICPTVFLPLRFLSITSLIGILSCITLLVVVYVDGSLKHEAPGSLRHPVRTNVGPDWKTLPLTFGLIMSGFAGHAVMPSLAKDMKNPKQFPAMINLAYLFSTVLYIMMAVAGYLMFGQDAAQEIIENLLHTPGYPRTVTRIAVWMIAINPLCKFALGIRPLTATLEYMLGIDSQHLAPQPPNDLDMKQDGHATDSSFRYSPPASIQTSSHTKGDSLETPRKSNSKVTIQEASSAFSRISLSAAPKPVKVSIRVMVKVITTALVVLIAIVWPNFESVMSLLGAFSAFIICVHGPICANLALNRKDFSWTRIAFDGLLLAISTVMCITGTIFSFLPR